jgi:hypothetical protein
VGISRMSRRRWLPAGGWAALAAARMELRAGRRRNGEPGLSGGAGGRQRRPHDRGEPRLGYPAGDPPPVGATVNGEERNGRGGGGRGCRGGKYNGGYAEERTFLRAQMARINRLAAAAPATCKERRCARATARKEMPATAEPLEATERPKRRRRPRKWPAWRAGQPARAARRPPRWRG